MGCLRCLLIVGAVFTVVTAIYLAQPVPSYLANPWKYRITRTIFNIICDVGWLADKLGLVDQRVVMKKGIDGLAHLNRPVDPKLVKLYDQTMDGVPVRIVEPLSTIKYDHRAALLYAHGGGFVIGSPAMFDIMMEMIASKTGAIIYVPDYRLAPKHPAPAPREDCEKVARYIFTHAKELRVDPLNVGIAGDSAGGNLATVLSLRFRDTGSSPQFRYQIPIVPWVQGLDWNLPSYQYNDKFMARIMTRYAMAIFLLSFVNESLDHIPTVLQNGHTTPEVKERYKHLVHWSLVPKNLIPDDFKPLDKVTVDTDLAKRIEKALLDPYNFPLMAKSLKNLPPALVIISKTDPLRDEGVFFVQRLKQDGVDVTVYHDDIGYHCDYLSLEEPFAMEAGLNIIKNIVEFMKKHI